MKARVHKDQMCLHDELALAEGRELAETWARRLAPFVGLPVLGAIDGRGCCEVAFGGTGDGPNLLAFGGHLGRGHVHGWVADPETYARRYALGRGAGA